MAEPARIEDVRRTGTARVDPGARPPSSTLLLAGILLSVLALPGGPGAAAPEPEPPGDPAGNPPRAGSGAEDGHEAPDGNRSDPGGEGRDDPAGGPEPGEAEPAGELSETIVVTATGVEERLGETAAAVSVLRAEELAALPAITLDEALRQVPGFTLFRRSGSRTSNPTTHGASLRGIGGSGAGRALVLADGVPLNDPFGGWVPWGLVPAVALERVEVLRGGASDLYGTGALAGVVQLVRRDPAAGEVLADVSGGSQGTASGSAWAGVRGRRWAGAAAVQGFTSDGYVQVAAEDRGPVDTRAGSTHGAVELTAERVPDEGGGPHVTVRAGLFDEERDNGTPLQENARQIRHGSAGADWTAGAGSVSLRAWASDQDFEQTFSAVADDRASERLVRSQVVPSERLGASARWTAAAGSRHTLVAGVEAGRVEGVSDERVFLPGRVIESASGGTQEEAALFVQDLLAVKPDLSVAASLRYDRWENDPADPDDGGSRRESAVSPRLSLRWQPRPAWGVVGAAYRSFRAPTLNELYRGFRVGDVVTDPNPALEAERITGAEAGVVWTPALGRPGGTGQADLRLRANLFWMRLDDPIANVTLATGPDLIQRQRQNLGRTRSRGLELQADARLGRRWSVSGGYLLADAEVERFPADPELEGLDVAQVPEHQASLQLRRRGERLDAALAGRWTAEQFDDDRNLFPLDELFLVDLRAGWRLTPALTVYATAENLLDEEVTVGRTPVRTVASPRLLRLGLRWEP